MSIEVSDNSAVSIAVKHSENADGKLFVITQLRISKPNIKKIEAYILVANFDEPSCPWQYWLEGEFCNKNGAIEITPNGTIGEVRREFCVRIRERMEEDFAEFIHYFSNLDWPGFDRMFSTNDTQLPSFALKLKLLCRYQSYQSENWHWIEASSEAFIYKPKPPRVLRAEPNDVQIFSMPTQSVKLQLHLNRSLIPGYDTLTKIELTFGSDQSNPIQLPDTCYQLERNRVLLNLGPVANLEIFRLAERVFCTISIHGNTARVDWVPNNDRKATIVLQYAATTNPNAPNKHERRERNLEPDEAI